MMNKFIHKQAQESEPGDCDPEGFSGAVFPPEAAFGLFLLGLLVLVVVGTIYLSNIYKCSMESTR